MVEVQTPKSWLTREGEPITFPNSDGKNLSPASRTFWGRKSKIRGTIRSIPTMAQMQAPLWRMMRPNPKEMAAKRVKYTPEKMTARRSEPFDRDAVGTTPEKMYWPRRKETKQQNSLSKKTETTTTKSLPSINSTRLGTAVRVVRIDPDEY